MPTMRRRRKDGDGGLEPRVYLSRGSYFYVHPGTKRWEALGKDKEEANRRGRLYNDPLQLHGTVVYWMDQFLVHCEERVKAGTMAARTLSDYTKAIIAPTEDCPSQGALRTFFKPEHVTQFLEVGAKAGRAVRANREKACFSSFMTWLVGNGKVPGLLTNPCMKNAGVKRNRETKRERYVTHEEFREVMAVASRSEKLLMELTYRTLQRPESDIILWDDRVIVNEGGRRFLRFKQNKTGMSMKIGFTIALDGLLPVQVGTVRTLRAPLVTTLKGEHYTYSGLAAMLRRSIQKANEARSEKGYSAMEYFGYRDLKGKGATDMYYLAKVPLAQIQQVLGHANQTTTEIYVKARWRETAEPDTVVMA